MCTGIPSAKQNQAQHSLFPHTSGARASLQLETAHHALTWLIFLSKNLPSEGPENQIYLSTV